MLLELWPTEADKKHVQKLFDSEWIGEGAQVVGINLSASEKWPTKNWPIEHLARLCDILSSWNIRVVLTGTGKDRDLGQHLLRLTKSKPANFVAKTDIMQLAALIKRCQVFITPDSAPMHIAAAMRTPFIAFFGPTAATRHLPPAKVCVVMEKKMNCAPCYGKTCKIKTHACLREILPEDVAQAVKKIVAEGE
jgi:ADP-heptose:LPS heptosyltransferase